MYGLFLDWPRCPDGVVLDDGRAAPVGDDAPSFVPGVRPAGWAEPPKPHFRYRSDRRETRRHEISDLESPIILEMFNADGRTSLAAFLSRYGLLRTADEPMSVEEVEHIRSLLKATLEAATDGNREFGLAVINATMSGEVDLHHGTQLGPVRLTPNLVYSERSAGPTLELGPGDLLSFMIMECAMIAQQNNRLGSCQNCGTRFLTGSLTGRRSHAVYCSDRCRTASKRARDRLIAE